MNKEMMERIMEAGKYQKMAIRALVPDSKQEHLDVIEKELKALLLEDILSFVETAVKEDSGTSDKTGKAHKVTIE